MTFDPTEALQATLQREVEGLAIFREYRAISEQIDRVHTQRNSELVKLLTLAREHIAALMSGEGFYHLETSDDGKCDACDEPSPCKYARAQEFIDRLDLESL